MIDSDSFDAQLIAGLIQSGYSYDTMTIALNMKKKEMKLTYVTYSAVYGVTNRRSPLKRMVQKQKQASFDPDEKWYNARKS